MASSSTGWSLDHVVLVVDDLDAAVADFVSLGFCIGPGGRTGPVHNALIFFADGTYLELTCPVSRTLRLGLRLASALGLLTVLERVRPGLVNRFLHWFGGPTGLQDWCLRAPSAETGQKAAATVGLATVQARTFRRTRPDGEVAAWRLAAPVDRSEPFWIEDLTPPEVRVPWQEHSRHPNGVVGIHAVVVDAASRLPLSDLPVRVASDRDGPGPRLRLELRGSGHRLGMLPSRRTAGAWITVV